ncbi:MaoC family dehydratase [Pseudonocardia sulfidoxydans NBRC 16205]|uniref:MaoC family dehydratase n=1 Tax=Pseudonocardia sulfidoxydans NBRC 16205 TaxID=1223511 RepID=A0A511DKJ0_9PSEU|nr:MaoC/PaaZ C-terminal domain-containing protein [Pseudonocardia sulfidoxydans]GEL25340.1 MaoC family dehydratase [Pseudonocardia sulfidoxydans NBRC 16205]
MTGVFATADELVAASGRDLGTTGWVEVDAARAATFSQVTADEGWGDGLPGTLVLSYAAALLAEVFAVPGASMGVNYGLDDVRFGDPVPVGSRVRLRARIDEAAPGRGGAVQVAVGVVIERDGTAEPACTARLLARFHFEGG